MEQSKPCYWCCFFTANIGTTITLTGNGHYVVLYEKGAGCPIGTVDDKGNIVANTSDFTVTGISE
jgi:hypothetical protein